MDETHKVLFLNPDTLEVNETVPVSPPFTLGLDSLKTANRGFYGILAPYIIVEITFEGVITPEMLADFQREIAMKELEKNYKQQQINLMNDAPDYDAYTAMEIELKKKYFDVKKEIALSSTPLLVDLSLNL